jgi:HK97 family phage portal protein
MFKWLNRFKANTTLPSAWSWRQWQATLRGDLTGDLSIADLTKSSAVIACSGLIADTLAAAPLGVVQRIPTGGLRQVTQANANAALLSLTFDDRAASLFGALLVGNGWLWLAPDGTLCALDSNRTSAYIDAQQRVWVRQGNDPYRPYSSVAHFRFKSQPGYILGYNPCLLASDSVGADLALIRMAKALAKNVQSPGGVLVHPTELSEEAAVRLLTSWQESVGGERAGAVALLEDGLDFKPIQKPSASDSELTAALEWSAADVCRLYNVPPTLVGLLKDSNKATSSEENRAFYARCLKPWAARISDVLGRLLLSDEERKAGLSIETSLDELSLGQGVERATYLRALVLSSIATPNEARNSLGMADLPDGGTLLSPVNMTPINQLGTSNE